jgi:predicted esterase
MLRNAGAEITLHWSDTGHQLNLEEVDQARSWLNATFPDR